LIFYFEFWGTRNLKVPLFIGCPRYSTLLPFSLASTLLPLPLLAGILLLPLPSGQSSITIQQHPSLTPGPQAIANTVWLSHWGPLFEVPPTVLNLRLGTPSFLGLTPSTLPILSFPKLWLICVIYQTSISFVRGSYFSFVLILSVADVAKGSSLLPACFVPFYLLCMYMYVCRIWLDKARCAVSLIPEELGGFDVSCGQKEYCFCWP